MFTGQQGTPFPFDRPVSPDALIDRDDELAELARRAADRVNVRLVAPRRYGKTSLAAALGDRLEPSAWRSVRVDLHKVADLTDVARRVAVAYGELDAGWLRTHVAGLLARVGVTVGVTGPSVSLAARPADGRGHEAAEHVLFELLDLPLVLHRADGRATHVVFDEFQDLLVARDDLDGLLRSRIQHHGDAAAYVFAGSEPSMMRRIFDDRERPLYGQALPLALDPLPVDAALAELAGRFSALGLEGGVALGQLVAFAAGHPQRTMLLAYLLHQALDEGAEPHAATASAVLDRALALTDGAHAAVWQGLDAAQRAVLAALCDGRPPTSGRLAAEHGVARSTLGGAAGRLEAAGHTRRVGRSTVVVDPLLAEWVRRR